MQSELMGEEFQEGGDELSQNCQENTVGDERCRLDLAVLVGMVLGWGWKWRSDGLHTNCSKERAEGRSINNKPFEAVWS